MELSGFNAVPNQNGSISGDLHPLQTISPDRNQDIHLTILDLSNFQISYSHENIMLLDNNIILTP